MYVTLNISNTSIRLLAVEGRRVTRWGEAPLASGLVRDGLILQPPAVGEAIGALLKETRIPGESVITCLTGLVFTYRFLSLPRMKPALRDEAIRRAARKEIPLPLEEVYFSSQNMGIRQNEQDIFISGVARHLVDATLQTLAAASVKPYLMDLKPLALARAANRGEAIIVSLEPDCFDIVLVVKGIPVILYTASPRWEGATPEENIRQVADELMKTVGFYNSTHLQEPISPTTPLLLTGKLSSEAATAGLIQNEVEYTVEPLVPQLQFPADLPVASYTANMGLALKRVPAKAATKEDGARFHDININILAGKYRPPKPKPISAKRFLAVTVLILAVVLIFPVYRLLSQAGAETARLQADLAGINRELDQTALAASQAAQTETAIRSLTGQTGALEQEYKTILAHRGDLTNDLRLVTGALPPQTVFTSLKVDSKQITVEGEALNPYQVVSYALALEALQRFQQVLITEIDEAPASAAPDEARQVTTFKIVISRY